MGVNAPRSRPDATEDGIMNEWAYSFIDSLIHWFIKFIIHLFLCSGPKSVFNQDAIDRRIAKTKTNVDAIICFMEFTL